MISTSQTSDFQISGSAISSHKNIHLDLANYLCNNGYKMKKVIDSDKNPRFKVFLFEDSKAIQDCIATYLSQKEV